MHVCPRQAGVRAAGKRRGKDARGQVRRARAHPAAAAGCCGAPVRAHQARVFVGGRLVSQAVQVRLPSPPTLVHIRCQCLRLRACPACLLSEKIDCSGSHKQLCDWPSGVIAGACTEESHRAFCQRGCEHHSGCPPTVQHACRDISNSPFFVNEQRLGRTSVSEEIESLVAPHYRCEAIKFNSAGAEQ